MDCFRNLPEEITLEILTRLPSHHPLFSKMHLHRLNHPSADDDSGKLGFLVLIYQNGANENFHYIEYDENHESTPTLRITRINLTPPFEDTTVMGSCNGLICLAEGLSVCICNPIVREYVMLPEISRDSCDDVERYYDGKCSFGYVSSTNEYKVVGMYESKTSVEVHIYTLGSGNGWRNLGKFTFKFDIYTWHVAGIFVNGALYWLSDKLEKIIVFDLVEEKFSEHLSPPPLPESDWWYDRIGVLDGFLFLAICPHNGGDGFSDIWLLKDKNNSRDMKERDERQ
ncbi:F-box protein At1g52495-like [Papaver somniferum]|uniref:F-box protein At1g52495-like n=1 Tax=Papaver somniferum TaxID=3469 RepID=UPI000E6F7ED8|nr:F-box protein At1g52495-like [Papaver somniferum]